MQHLLPVVEEILDRLDWNVVGGVPVLPANPVYTIRQPNLHSEYIRG